MVAFTIMLENLVTETAMVKPDRSTAILILLMVIWVCLDGEGASVTTIPVDTKTNCPGRNGNPTVVSEQNHAVVTFKTFN